MDARDKWPITFWRKYPLGLSLGSYHTAACFVTAGLANDYDIVARNTDPASIQVALAARKGLLTGTSEWIEEFPTAARFENLKEATNAREMVSVTIAKFSRPLLRVTIQPRGTRPKPPEITVYIAHLKSKGPARLRFDNPKPPVLENHAEMAKSVVAHVRRIAEAGAMRALLDDEMKGNTRPFVVLGDLNDGTLATSTELLTGDPGYRFFEKSRAGSRSDAGLYSVEKLQQIRSFRLAIPHHQIAMPQPPDGAKIEHLCVNLPLKCHGTIAEGTKWHCFPQGSGRPTKGLE